MSELRAPCPTCGKPAVLTAANAWRPFCCERCKLIDLGEWMTERYAIPTDESEPPEGKDRQ